MFHYLFTNDLRISNLESFLIEAGKCFVENKVPSAYEDKNANNNMNTLGFYFNLTEESNCAKLCSNGKIRPVVLNFIKKFQFPNPRTTDSLNEAINDGILIAPLRIIIQSLYFMNMINKDEAYLTDKEIADYIFFNDEIAKKPNPNIFNLVNKIISERNNEKSEAIEDDEILEQKGFYWKQCKRQIREMVKVLCWSGCAVRDEQSHIRIHHDNLTTEDKAELFEILSYSNYWYPEKNKTANENKESYQRYMDIKKEKENEILNIEYLLSLKNQDFAFETINILKEYADEELLRILCSSDESKKYTKHFRAILIDVTEDIENNIEYYKDEIAARYYKETIDINNRKYIISNDWYYKTHNDLDNRTPYLDFIKKVINNAIKPYTKDDFLNEVYMDENEYEELKDLLLFKKNIILEGAPGVGKTFMAKRLAYSIIGVSNKEQIKEQVMSIQFHQSYSYEEFIEGIMPSVDGGFIQKYGIFKEFCNRASENPNKKYFFIIDEINRGNISKIFGELMVLIENDKRGQEMVLTYSNEYFKVPENVYIIGMMNTADRSLALMDYALRRRFDFYPVLPAFENPNFIEYIKSFNSKSFENIIEVVKKLNEAICKDEALGSGFMIGHSYFCNLQFYIGDINLKLKQIIKYSIIPLIKEYWYDDESNKVELWEKELYGAINE